MSAQPAILVVDDDREVVDSLARALSSQGLGATIATATSVAEALSIAANCRPAVFVIDLCLEAKRDTVPGLNLLRDLRLIDSTASSVVLTGCGSIEIGIRALNLGAAHFLEKPAEIPLLSALLRDGISRAHLRREHLKLQRREGAALSRFLVGDAPQMREIVELVRQYAETAQPVLILGETGTGKGRCARAIHDFGERSHGKFIRYQPEYTSFDLTSSALFGHVRGAFTGAATSRRGLIELADHGTLFLDEIDCFPPEVQVALLGVLQERRFRPIGATDELAADFRLICASNAELSDSVAKGRVRRDFFHRIAHCVIELPPLRERLSDIPLLVAQILEDLAHRESVQVEGVSGEVIELFRKHEWPGNIRELEAVVEGAAYRARYRGRHAILQDDVVISRSVRTCTPRSLNEEVARFKFDLVRRAIEKNCGSRELAAADLGVDRSTIGRILSR